jgi:hypothetical protein
MNEIISNDNFTKSSSDTHYLILNFIDSLERKAIDIEKLNFLNRYLEYEFNHNKYSQMKDYQMNKLLLDMIEDYNEIIAQSIQAIKSLQFENLNLHELLQQEKSKNHNANFYNDNNSLTNARDTYKFMNSQSVYNENNMNMNSILSNNENKKLNTQENEIKLNYEYDLQKINSDLPLRDKSISLENNLSSKILTQNSKEMNLKLESKDLATILPTGNNDKCKTERTKIPLREKIKSGCEKQTNYDIKLIKITNDILKIITSLKNPIQQQNFANRYAEGNFKQFLNNLIDYLYDYDTLLNLKSDIELLEDQPEHFYEESFSNLIKNSTNQNKAENLQDTFYRANNIVPIEIPGGNKSKLIKSKKFYSSSCQDGFENSLSFEKNLRSYKNKENDNGEKRPFNRFTRVHGAYFDKKLPVYTDKVSPSRSRSKSQEK